MANAKICDRCGKFYKPYKRDFKVLLEDDEMHIYYGNIECQFARADMWCSDDASRTDLCQECFNKVLMFVSGLSAELISAEKACTDDEKS